MQRGEPGDQLQVLREQEQQAGVGEHRGGVGERGHPEQRRREQVNVEQRLPARRAPRAGPRDERPARGGGDDQLGQGERDVAAERLHAQHERDHGQHRQDEAQQVELTRRRRASRDSGSTAGARASSATITGTLTRNTEPHQACSSSTPPSTGPSAAPAANPVAQMARARRRWVAVDEQRAQQRQRGGHQHRAEHPEQGAGRDEVRGVRRERGGGRDRTEAGDADQQQPAPADPVAERAHRDQEPGQGERVDVDDPQQLGRARCERRTDRGQREAQHRVVDGDEQGRQEQHGQAEPLAAAGAGRARPGRVAGTGGGHRSFLRSGGSAVLYRPDGIVAIDDIPAVYRCSRLGRCRAPATASSTPTRRC